MALWTNFQPGPDAGLIDWYTALVGITAFVALTMHGSLWVALKTEGDLQTRCYGIARRLWIPALSLVLFVSALSFYIQPHLLTSIMERPWGIVFPLLSAAGLIGVPLSLRRRQESVSFLSSCLFILGLLCSAAMGLYPDVLPSNGNAGGSLTITSVSAADYGLRKGLFWFVPALALALAYSVFVYRHFAGKVGTQPREH
jgi:cytochrome d ubiquinol oxidase subunit II